MANLDRIIVTGAGRCIGQAAERDLTSTGAQIFCSIQTNNSATTVRKIKEAGGIADSLSIGRADYQGAERIVSDWIGRHPSQRIGLVLAFAILGSMGPLLTSDLHRWDLAYRVGVLGNLAVVTALLPTMLAGRFGRIVGFAGGGSAYANATFPAYSAAKTTMVRVIENLHEDLKDQRDFATVCLAPGAVDTDMLRQVRNVGGYVNTTVSMSEPIEFIGRFLSSESCGFSGCFVHVRDAYEKLLNGTEAINSDARWKLRRIES